MFIYLHIPFCTSRCIYCDFYVVLEKYKREYGGQAAYVDAVLKEIHLRLKTARASGAIRSLYAGGGTPSLLPASDYRKIFDAFGQYATMAPDAELTLEVNPNALRDLPDAYRETGFNRVSVGIQSFNDPELKKLSRAHSAADAIACVRDLQRAGFENISIDLMYGIPGQTLISWRQTLETAVNLGIQHVSMYGLKVEEATPLNRLVTTGSYPLPDDDATVAMYFEGAAFLGAHGFHRYEFSNLALPGRESRHNLNYWDNGFYHAFGVSAHGYVEEVPSDKNCGSQNSDTQNKTRQNNGPWRYETVRDLAAYLTNPLAGEVRPCPPSEQLENALIFGLRKTEGVDIAALEAGYGFDFRERYGAVVEKYKSLGFFEFVDDRLRLTPQAIPVSNEILAGFLG